MIDLFDPRLPNEKLHRSFRLIQTDPNYAKVMPVIQSWAAGLLDRKGETDKFVKEFQSTFNSSMWEIYLNKALIDMGFSVDYSKSSPDFFVSSPGQYEFNIEAVISDQSANIGNQPSANDQDFKARGALKLIGKIKDKLELYRGSKGKKHPYSSLNHVKGRPFVVAIAPFDSDHSLMQNNELINLVLFGISPPLAEQERKTTLTTASGAPVDVGIFTNDSFKEISAVIFSTVGTFGKAVVESKIERLIRTTRYRTINKVDVRSNMQEWQLGTHRDKVNDLNYLIRNRWEFESEIAGSDVHIYQSAFHHETHLDGLHVYFNPYAEIPFDQSVICSEEITKNYFDVEKRESIHVHPDGALVSRQAFPLNPLSLHNLLIAYGFQ